MFWLLKCETPEPYWVGFEGFLDVLAVPEDWDQGVFGEFVLIVESEENLGHCKNAERASAKTAQAVYQDEDDGAGPSGPRGQGCGDSAGIPQAAEPASAGRDVSDPRGCVGRCEVCEVLLRPCSRSASAPVLGRPAFGTC